MHPNGAYPTRAYLTLYLTSFVFDDAEQARDMFADEIEGNIYSRFSIRM
ncbi:MAG: hypothetical protein IPI52_00565 [Bacteroidetes bacterium]|nr:hypothetical protein [Bacteroidota bacterium]